MLRLMLDSHPDLAIPGEGHFIPFAYRKLSAFTSPAGLDAEGLARQIMRGLHFRRWKIPVDFVIDRVRRLDNPDFSSVVGALYMSYAEFHGKVRWGDKTPVYVRLIPMLADLFPTARFVHMIRDGRDVALSYMSVPWGPTSVWHAARKWEKDVTAGRSAGESLGDDRYLEVRYEDLVADPSGELQKLCGFSALDFDMAMLAYHTDAIDRLQCGPDATEYHRSAAAPPSQGLRDWRSQMKSSDVAAFEAVAGETLTQLGYERRLRAITRARQIEVMARAAAIDVKIAGSKVKKRALRRFAHRHQATLE